MNALRFVALLACGLGAALGSRAADRTGPAPTDVIFPRGSEAAATTPEAPGITSVIAPVPSAAMGGMLPTLGYLVAFGALIGGAWFVLKRGSLGRPFAKSEGKLRVLETKMLGNRQFLMVVEYDDAKLLIGVCPGRIDYLTPLAGHPLATGAMAVTSGDDEEPTALAFPSPEARR